MRKPFHSQIRPCAQCDRDVQVDQVFFHYARMHNQRLLATDGDGREVCALCGMELPVPDSRNQAWKHRIQHFRDEHGKRLIDVGRLL